MADRSVFGSPYDAVAHLWSWSVGYQTHVRGKLIRDRLPPLETMDAADAVALLYLYVLEAITSGELRAMPDLERVLGDPFHLTDETFGTGSTAERGQAAMMDLFPSAIPIPE